MESIKVIVISTDKVFKNSMVANFENISIDIITHDNSMHIFKYLETKGLKLIVLKPEFSFGLNDITKLGTLEKQGENMKILLFQKDYKNEVNTLNRETINYLKKNTTTFKTIKLHHSILD